MVRTKNIAVKRKFTVEDPFASTSRRNPERTKYYDIKKGNSNVQYYFGNILIGCTNNTFPESFMWSTCKLYFTKTVDLCDSDNSLEPKENIRENICMEFDENLTIVVQLAIESSLFKDLITLKVFHMDFQIDNSNFYIKLNFIQLPLPKFNARQANLMKIMFSLLYNISNEFAATDPPSEQFSESGGISKIYKDISKLREMTAGKFSYSVQHPKLKPTLRKYQEDAVKWMVFKEKHSTETKEIEDPLFTKVKLKSGLEIYYSKFTGEIELNAPIISVSNNGGILADEMGLGKTVEVLGCILSHPKPKIEEQIIEDVIKQCDNDNSDAKDEMKMPTIEKQTCKRKFDKNDFKQSEHHLENKSKKIKIPDKFVKNSSKKSATKIALEMWYENMLAEVTGSGSRKRYVCSEEDLKCVRCICGNTSERGTVKCIDCDKIQHKKCLGYTTSYGPYRCPQCWMNQPLLECGATLIVSPISLRTQWCNEICKHIKGDLRVLQYQGSSATPVYPVQLQEFDLVITTYNVLQSELRLTESEQGVSLRRQKKYGIPGSSLTRVKWWRLCLDEAQTVDAPGKMVSAMAHKLNANFRWAVTGTPISKDISDLFGLISYLQISPYNDFTTWKNLLYDPYVNGNREPMYKFLAENMWRSCKEDVLDQINIPKQTVKEHLLEFSAVEKYFYKREHELTCDAFVDKLRSYDLNITLQSLDKSTTKKILQPLLCIRQACIQPNTVRGKYLTTKKQVNSMQELLDALILKNITEGEENLRLIVSSLNGLAGIYLLLQNPTQAINEYRKVLQLAARFHKEDSKEEKLAVDKLQLIHAMHNLGEALVNFPPDGHTLRDSTLRQDCVKVEQKYIEKYINQSVTAYMESEKMTNLVLALQDKFVLNIGQWYSDFLDVISECGYFDEFKAKLKNLHEVNNIMMSSEFQTERNILYTVGPWDEQLLKERSKLMIKMSTLYNYDSESDHKIIIVPELVQNATDCHLRPQKKNKNSNKSKCDLCKTNEFLKKYEFKLFTMKQRTITYEEMSLQGSWKPTSEEFILRALLNLAKAKHADENIIKDGETHIKLVETLKKEFKEIRKLWTFLDQQICAQDELDMCKIRLTIKEPSVEDNSRKEKTNILKKLSYVLENKLENHHMLNEHELDFQRTVLMREEQQGTANLEKNLGVQSYLQTLRKQQYEGKTPDPCPICKNVLEKHWSILPCGHSYCLECIQILLERNGCLGATMVCSICRSRQKIADISYLKGEVDNTENSESNKIVGSYSTKIEAIIKLLIELRQKDPNVKVLLFSSWFQVLKCFRDALNKNDINNELLQSSRFEESIEKFKNADERITVLLLPVSLGSKGLNLIEATHVLLVEPLLNPADELQAIGRVHRIGQTKPTFVHKFLIKNTIEESIYKATKTHADHWDKTKVTLQQLMDLFISTEDCLKENIVNLTTNEHSNIIPSTDNLNLTSDHNQACLENPTQNLDPITSEDQNNVNLPQCSNAILNENLFTSENENCMNISRSSNMATERNDMLGLITD